MEPVSEEGLFTALGHAGNGEVVLFSGEQADSVLVDGANLMDGNLHAAMRILRAVEDQTAGGQAELSRTASAENLVVLGVIDQRRKR